MAWTWQTHTHMHTHTHVANILSHDRLESQAYVANRRSISVCTNCRCLQQWSSCFFGCRKHAANSLVLNLHLELLNVGGNVGGMKIHCSVLQYCDSVSHLLCIFVQEPEVLRLDHTHFPGSPESELEEPDFSPSDDSFCFFLRTAWPWNILGDLRWSWVARGDGSIYGETGRWRWEKRGAMEMAMARCWFWNVLEDPKIP